MNGKKIAKKIFVEVYEWSKMFLFALLIAFTVGRC